MRMVVARTVLGLASMGLGCTGLAGCGWEPPGALLAADAASVVVFGRSIGDLGYSAISGRDCSVVRLDKGQTYCAPQADPVRTAYCTRTLAAVDCWSGPALGAVNRPGVGDTPPPTQAQLRFQASRWPRSLNAMP